MAFRRRAGHQLVSVSKVGNREQAHGSDDSGQEQLAHELGDDVTHGHGSDVSGGEEPDQAGADVDERGGPQHARRIPEMLTLGGKEDCRGHERQRKRTIWDGAAGLEQEAEAAGEQDHLPAFEAATGRDEARTGHEEDE